MTGVQTCALPILTVISDKERLVKIIKDKYGTVLSDEEIKGLKALNYTKWGRLSAKLLDGIFETDSEGEVGSVSIIEKMRTDTENFMELLSNKHNYKRAIELVNSESIVDERVTYRAVDELYCSPAVKRSIWSALKIVREIVKVQGHRLIVGISNCFQANNQIGRASCRERV